MSKGGPQPVAGRTFTKRSPPRSFPILIFCGATSMGFPGGAVGKNPPVSAGDVGSIPELGRTLEKEMVTHSSSYLGNPMDRGAWRATAHGVSKSQTRLNTHTHNLYSSSYLASEGFLMLPASLDKYPLCSYCDPKAPYGI